MFESVAAVGRCLSSQIGIEDLKATGSYVQLRFCFLVGLAGSSLDCRNSFVLFLLFARVEKQVVNGSASAVGHRKAPLFGWRGKAGSKALHGAIVICSFKVSIEIQHRPLLHRAVRSGFWRSSDPMESVVRNVAHSGTAVSPPSTIALRARRLCKIFVNGRATLLGDERQGSRIGCEQTVGLRLLGVGGENPVDDGEVSHTHSDSLSQALCHRLGEGEPAIRCHHT